MLQPDTEWERKAKKIWRRRGSYDGLSNILSEVMDFDPDKLRITLYEYACETLEKELKNPTTHSAYISLLMRMKMIEVIEKAYRVFRSREGRLYLKCNFNEIQHLVDYEHMHEQNATFPWVVSNANKVKNGLAAILAR